VKRLLAAAMLLSASAAGAEDTVVRFYGYAYDLESNEYAFTEILEQRMANGQWVGGSTDYFLPDGREIGRKTLDFSRDPFVPVFRLTLGEGYAEGISDNGDPIVVTRESGGKMKSAKIGKQGLIAADAGMARLLRAHLDSLQRGETLAFRVVAPSRLDAYRFRARRVADAAFEGKPAVRIQVEMDSMLKLVAGPLFFTYDPATLKLLEFRGVTNIRDPKTGEDFRVRISYYSVPPKEAPKLPPLTP
jgi:hypothetical protein